MQLDYPVAKMLHLIIQTRNYLSISGKGASPVYLCLNHGSGWNAFVHLCTGLRPFGDYGRFLRSASFHRKLSLHGRRFARLALAFLFAARAGLHLWLLRKGSNSRFGASRLWWDPDSSICNLRRPWPFWGRFSGINWNYSHCSKENPGRSSTSLAALDWCARRPVLKSPSLEPEIYRGFQPIH